MLTNATNLEEHLCDLEANLADLLQLQRFKQLAAATLNAGDLEAFTSREQQLLCRIGELSQLRAGCFPQSGADPAPLPSLSESLKEFPEDVQRRMKSKVRRIRGLAKRIRLQATSSWIACRRACRDAQQMLELIASGGDPAADSATGLEGVVLDSTA